MDAAELRELAGLLARLPRLCIDHLGLSRRGLPHLLRQVERGAKVKASGLNAETLGSISDVSRMTGTPAWG